MQQHPVPQNIMAVEFRFIGNLTIRQFAYVGGTGLFGWLIVSSPLPVFIRWPTALFIFLFGLGLAFLPFNEISLDRWVAVFFRAIFAPTQRIWKKTPKTLEFLEIELPKSSRETSQLVSENRKVLDEYLKTFKKPKDLNELDLAEINYLRALNFELEAPNVQATQRIPSFFPERRAVAVPKNTLLASPVPFEPIAAVHYPNVSLYVKPIVSQSRGIRNIPLETPKIQDPTLPPLSTQSRKIFSQEDLIRIANEYRNQLKVLRDEREYLLAQVQNFQNQMKELQTKSAYTKIRPEVAVEINKLKNTLAATQKEKQELLERAEKLTTVIEDLRKASEAGVATSPRAKIIAPQRAIGKMAPPLTATANVINGIIKDAKGFLLTDVIILVKDRGGEPVRALKTNKIGQFAISTPLPNGVYVLELEKEGCNFDMIEVKLEGNVLLPIEVRAKRP